MSWFFVFSFQLFPSHSPASAQSESIAFAGDTAVCDAALESRLGVTIGNARSLANRQAPLNAATNFLAYFGAIVAYLLVAVRALRGGTMRGEEGGRGQRNVFLSTQFVVTHDDIAFLFVFSSHRPLFLFPGFKGDDAAQTASLISRAAFATIMLVSGFSTILSLAASAAELAGYTNRVGELLEGLDYVSPPSEAPLAALFAAAVRLLCSRFFFLFCGFFFFSES